LEEKKEHIGLKELNNWKREGGKKGSRDNLKTRHSTTPEYKKKKPSKGGQQNRKESE